MMTVKDFMEKTTGADEYNFHGDGIYTYCNDSDNDKARIIDNYAERKIISINFYVDCYDDKCVDIEIE